MMTEYQVLKIDVAFMEPLYEINIGYVARVMKNFSMGKLYIISPRCEIGAIALRYSAHAQDLLLEARIINGLDHLLSKYDLVIGTTGKIGAGPLRRYVTPDEFARKLASYKDGKVLILLGREDIGLKNEELKLCDLIISIPANPLYSVMNVSHAAAIIFYEIYKTLSMRERTVNRMPKREEIEVFLRYVREILRKRGKKEDKIERALLTLRRIIGSCMLSSSDIRLLIDIVKGV